MLDRTFSRAVSAVRRARCTGKATVVAIVSATLSAACRTFSACSRSSRAAARRCSASARLALRLRLLDALDDSLGFLIAERLQDCGKELRLLGANMLLKRSKESECGRQFGSEPASAPSLE